MKAFAVLLCGAVAVLVFAQLPALASMVIGTGTPASCAESGFMLSPYWGGGSVTFNCGASPVTITVTSQKTIYSDLSIDGGGLITLSGDGRSSIFKVNEDVTATLANLTIINGATNDAGGAISNAGTLTVSNSSFSGNVASQPGYSSAGGAIFNVGTLTVTTSTFSNNSANGVNGEGGAIDNGGTLTVSSSTFYDNFGNVGGAISNAGTSTVSNSTFSGNNGGAIYNIATFTVSNCTFSGNFGSAIAIPTDSSGTVTVSNSTFSGNSGADAGAIYNTNQRRPVILKNTIVANSNVRCDFPPLCTSNANCVGTIIDGGHNVDSGTTCAFSNSKSSLSNTNPLLDTAGLTNNGGPTQTIALEAGSPAINAGDEATCASAPVNNLDQRGYVRPGTGATNCSIGAFEYNSSGCPSPLVGCGTMNICASLNNDPNNCGECGAVCALPHVCIAGQCAATPIPTITNTPTQTNTPIPTNTPTQTSTSTKTATSMVTPTMTGTPPTPTTPPSPPVAFLFAVSDTVPQNEWQCSFNLSGSLGLSRGSRTFQGIGTEDPMGLRNVYQVIYVAPGLNNDDYISLKALVAPGGVIEQFVNSGGVAVINATGASENQPNVAPDDVGISGTSQHDSETIALATHLYITGGGYGGELLSTDSFGSWQHTDLGILTNVPSGAKIVLANSDGPSWAEYRHGNGWVIVTTLTFCTGSEPKSQQAAARNLLRYSRFLFGSAFTPTATLSATATVPPSPTSTPSQMPTNTSTGTKTATPLVTSTIMSSVTPTGTTSRTATVTPTLAQTRTVTASATPAPEPCVGDCNNDGPVTVDELLTMVNIALGNLDVTACLAGDVNHDGHITIDEVLTSVNNALNGCAALIG